ncbi:MAG: HlyC/CorC family transporter [Pyrinomonadaceae bacterium]|nr:HlyC/CorC family transporter [Pyrinomonadaceae bacterium]
MEQIGLEVLLIFVLLLINGLFSMSEIAVVSARHVRLQKLADEGNLGAKAAIKLTESPDRFLSTVQIGITLVGVLLGAFGGATLAFHLVPFVEKIAIFKPFAREISFGLVVLIITYFSLVIGELVPKRIGLNAPERIAALISRPMNFISKMTAPAVWLLSESTKALLKLLRQKKSDETSVTEEEIRAILIEGTTEGVIEKTEEELMKNVINLDDQSISALMTPRTKIAWIDLNDSSEVIKKKIENSPYSRRLVADKDLDNIHGFIKAKDLLDLYLSGGFSNIRSIVKNPIFIPETTSALEVLQNFRDSNTHLAVIIDEFGSTQGIVTTNDILEAIVGDLPFDGITNESAVQREDGSWLLDARLSNTEYRDVLGMDELPEDEFGMYETLAGFVIKRLEKLPATGDRFDWGAYSFEVVDMDGTRVDRVLVSPKEI